MKPAPFAYARAEDVAGAVRLRAENPDGAEFLAGGQSLMASLNMRLAAPELLIDLNSIAELDEIAQSDGVLRIGAMARQAVLGRSDRVARHAPLIARAIPHIAHPAIRNRGTIGGSIALADPAAELPACLVALDAVVEIAGANGEPRRVAAADFFRGLYLTDLREGELITAIEVPAPADGARSAFAEIARRHGDYALAGLAAHDAGADGLRLVYFGVGERPLRAAGAERACRAEGVEAGVAALAGEIEPMEDDQTSAAARLHLAGVLLHRVHRELYGEESA